MQWLYQLKNVKNMKMLLGFIPVNYNTSELTNVSFSVHAMSTVSHHDPELTFNHSFIEPPSSGWVTEGSSFDSDEEEGEALYCVPPREGKGTFYIP